MRYRGILLWKNSRRVIVHPLCGLNGCYPVVNQFALSAAAHIAQFGQLFDALGFLPLYIGQELVQAFYDEVGRFQSGICQGFIAR